MERPLSTADLQTIAEYLAGTDEELWIAPSELGFDPWRYEEGEVRVWLKQLGLRQDNTGVWHHE